MPNHSCAKPMPDDAPCTIAELWATFRRRALAEHPDDDQQLTLAKSIFYAGAYGCGALVFTALSAGTEAEREQALKRIDDELDAWRQAKTKDRCNDR